MNEKHFMDDFIRDAKNLTKSNGLNCSAKEILDLAIYLYEDCVRHMMLEGQRVCNCDNIDVDGTEEEMN